MKTIIRLSLLAALAVLVTTGPTLAQGKGGGGSTTTKDGQRLFYLTKEEYFPHQALNACASGFHMATLFEILEPSALKYDTSRGYTKADSGHGPPAFGAGWIRTGGDASRAPTAGVGNCQGWTEYEASSAGTVAALEAYWSSPIKGMWVTGAASCMNVYRVWCVQD